MLKLLLKWLLSAAALLGVAYIYGGVSVSGFGAAMIAGAMLFGTAATASADPPSCTAADLANVKLYTYADRDSGPAPVG